MAGGAITGAAKVGFANAGICIAGEGVDGGALA
jgi:hypothetical protein